MTTKIVWRKVKPGQYEVVGKDIQLERDDYAPDPTWILSVNECAAYFRTKSHAQGFLAACLSVAI